MEEICFLQSHILDITHSLYIVHNVTSFKPVQVQLQYQRDLILWSIAKNASGWEGRNFPSDRSLMMSGLVKTN